MKKLFLTAFMLLGLLFVSQAQTGWDTHLTKLTSAIKCNAGLYGLDGTQWGGGRTLSLSTDEVKYIISGFANPSQLFVSGPKVIGVKYMTTRADDNLIILKHGIDGVVCKKSKHTVTICKFSENNVTPAQANIATSNFADYLKSFGY